MSLNLSEKIDDGEMDLSMCDLHEVPVKEIKRYRKIWSLDLSNNHIAQITKQFPTSLANLTKLDLSCNKIRQLSQNFGELRQLKHLDLYKNQLQYLPLSFCNLRNLQWLDLKDNPLVSAILEAAGDCQDAEQCQKCATNIVYFFARLRDKVNEERELRRIAQMREQAELKMATQSGKVGKDRNKKRTKGQKRSAMQNDENEVCNNEQSTTSHYKLIYFLIPSLSVIAILFALRGHFVEEISFYLYEAGQFFEKNVEYLSSRIGNFFYPSKEETLTSYLPTFIANWF